MGNFINLDIDVLRSFVTGVKFGNFARAALAVGRSPSALSGQMRKLEMQVGATLFRKAGRGLALTAAGESLFVYAGKILALNDEAIGAIRHARLKGVVRLGMPADFAENWLPRVLGQFAIHYPMVQIEVHATRSAELVEQVRTGGLDFALAWGDAEGHPNARAIARLPVRWITTKSVQPGRDPDRIIPIVAFDEPCVFRRLGLDALNAQGMRWRLSFVSPSLPGLWAAVGAGLGITMRTAIALPATMTLLPPRMDGLPELPPVLLSLHQSSAQLPAVAALLSDLIVASLADAGLA